jgi:non-heme chloroperoxidase
MKIFLAGAMATVAAWAQQSGWPDPSKHQVRMVNVQEGVRLEVLDWGGSGRPVVLLAGSGHSAHVFDEFAPKLARFCHVYGVTRRGYGASSQPSSGYDNQRLSDDIVQVLDALKLEKPVLAGHSMAGGEITTVGGAHPSRLGGLVYFDALGDPRDFPASDPAYMKLLRGLPAGMQSGPPPATAEEQRSFAGYRAWQLRGGGGAFPESELRNTFETNPDGSKGRFKTPGWIHNAIGDGERKRDYSGIRVPVLAFLEFPRTSITQLRPDEYQPKNAEEGAAMEAFGKAHAAFVNRWMENLKSHVKDVQLVDLPGAGHYLFMTREAEVLRKIQEFVTGLK